MKDIDELPDNSRLSTRLHDFITLVVPFTRTEHSTSNPQALSITKLQDQGSNLACIKIKPNQNFNHYSCSSHAATITKHLTTTNRHDCLCPWQIRLNVDRKFHQSIPHQPSSTAIVKNPSLAKSRKKYFT